MRTTNTESWAIVVETLRRYVQDSGLPLTGLYDLARHIAISPYATGLFPRMSMHSLILAQTDTVYDGQERLIIDAEANSLVFSYTDAASGLAPAEKRLLKGYPAWHTTCRPEDGLATLARFIDRAGWFPKLLQADGGLQEIRWP